MMHSDDRTPSEEPRDETKPDTTPIDAEITVGDATETAKSVKESGEPFEGNFA